MPTDAGVRCFVQFQPDDLTVGCPLGRVSGELVPAADGVPVFLEHPAAALVVVPVFAPAQETVPQSPFHLLVGPFRRAMAVIKGPAPENGVELSDQVGLADSATAADDLTHLLQEGVRVVLGRLDEQSAAEFTEVLSEEVESGFDVRDAGLLG